MNNWVNHIVTNGAVVGVSYIPAENIITAVALSFLVFPLAYVVYMSYGLRKYIGDRIRRL